MNRTTRLKVLYVVVALSLVGATILFTVRVYPERLWLGGLLCALVLLLPGRLQGAVFRPFFEAARLQRTGQVEEALTHYQEFLADVKKRPWKKACLWLAWTVYTTDLCAMIHNNIAACHLMMGNWADARDACEEALRLDPLYPLPHLSLATIAAVDDEQNAVERHLRKAEKLGVPRHDCGFRDSTRPDLAEQH